MAADQRTSTDCVTANQYATGNTALGQQFCNIKKFINVDLNGTARLNDGVTLYGHVGNLFDERAPIAPGAYASAPNFLTSFHYAGLIGRTFKMGVRFEY